MTIKKIEIIIKPEDLTKIRLPIGKRPNMTHKPKKGHGSYSRLSLKKELRRLLYE